MSAVRRMVANPSASAGSIPIFWRMSFCQVRLDPSTQMKRLSFQKVCEGDLIARKPAL